MVKHGIAALGMVGLALAACTSFRERTKVPTQGMTSQAGVNVFPSGQIHREVVLTDYVEMPNCGDSAEMEASIERSRSIRHEITLDTGLEVSLSGDIKMLGTGVNVGTAVAATYGTKYGLEETAKRSLTFKVKEGTKVRYGFQVVEIWELGQLQIRIGNHVENIPYRFRRDFALEPISSEPLGCPVATPIESAGPTPVETRPVTPSPGQAWFGPPSFCLAIDADNHCTSPSSRLPAGTTKFYVTWQYENIPYGARFERIWLHNRNRLKHVDDIWDSAWGSASGVEYTYLHCAQGFADGDYRVEFYIDGQLLQSGSVHIGR